MNNKGKPLWILFGLGCGIASVVLVCAAVFMVIFVAGRTNADIEDPGKRTENALKALGIDEIPAGYHAMVTTDVPFVMKIAMLSDRPPDGNGLITGFDEWGFISFEFHRFGPPRDKMREFLAGKTDDPHVFTSNSVTVAIKESIDRGVIRRQDGDLIYATYRGSAGAREQVGEGIVSMVLFDCPDPSRSHLAIWFGPDPDPELPLTGLDLSKTPADEKELERFMRQFRFCRQ